MHSTILGCLDTCLIITCIVPGDYNGDGDVFQEEHLALGLKGISRKGHLELSFGVSLLLHLF